MSRQFTSLVTMDDSASIDAFARLRVSNPVTVFDSKQLHDNQPLFWDDSEVSGSGTTSTHSTDAARTRIAVAGTTAGRRVRQTFQRFNYQPGKSQLMFLTGVLSSGGGTGLFARVGLFDDQNGLFFESNEGTLQVVRRSYVTGSAVDAAVVQSSWNIDPLDGTGNSGVTIDATKTQIMVIDFEWLGVGRVRMGFVIDGIPIYCHQFLNTNSLDVVYMSTPNLPLRYEIENDGTGAAMSLDHICSSVISEGGIEATGPLRSASTSGTHVDANAADTVYAVIGIRQKTTHLDAVVEIEQASMLAETNDNFEWLLIFNPTVAGTFTYSDETNSSVQTAKGATANTVSGGTVMQSGFASTNQPVATEINNALKLGSAIDGTRDEIVLCVRPLSSNADIQATLTWRELN